MSIFRDAVSIVGLIDEAPWYRQRISRDAFRRVQLLSSGSPPIKSVPPWLELEVASSSHVLATPDPEFFANLDAQVVEAARAPRR